MQSSIHSLESHSRQEHGYDHGHAPYPQFLISTGAALVADLVSCFIMTPFEVLKQNAQVVGADARRSSPSAASFAHFFSHGGRRQVLPTTPVFKTSTAIAFAKFTSPRQLWSGYTALVAHSLPYCTIQMPLYEALKSILGGRSGRSLSVMDETPDQSRRDSKGECIRTMTIAAVSAGIAGGAAATLTAPMDKLN